MKRFDRLRKIALMVCKKRGHKMKPLQSTYAAPSYQLATWKCQVCKREVQVLTDPLPGYEVSVGGLAFKENCKDSRN